MKICPRCGKTFPDSERFCETDGTSLVTSAGAARQTAAMPDTAAEGSGAGTCPECGGRAEPGETICNFCGTRLVSDASGAPASAGTVYTGPAGQGRPVHPPVDPEDYVPARDRNTD